MIEFRFVNPWFLLSLSLCLSLSSSLFVIVANGGPYLKRGCYYIRLSEISAAGSILVVYIIVNDDEDFDVEYSMYELVEMQ